MKNKGYFGISAALKKKKLILITAVTVVIFIPILLAFVIYSTNPKENNTAANSTLTVSLYDGEALLFEESEIPERTSPSSLVYIFHSIINNLDKADKLPNDLDEEKMVIAIITKSDVKTEYKCYFSKNKDSSYCIDDSGNIFLISNSDATAFMSSKYSETLYKSSVPPKLLTTSNDIVLPIRADWNYINVSGQTLKSTKIITTDDTEHIYDMAGILGLNFDIVPDECSVKIFDGNVIQRQISYDKLSSIMVDFGTTLRLVVSATWYESSGLEFYGTVEYDFKILLRDRSRFIPDKTELSVGNFVIVACTNIIDINKISFSSTPDIGVSPIFFNDGNIVRTIIPFAYDLNAGKYDITFSYGATQETITFDLLPFSKSVNTVEIDSKSYYTFNSHTNNNVCAEFDTIISDLGAPYSENIFCRGAFADYQTDGSSLLYQYGTTFKVEDSAIAHVLKGSMYSPPSTGGATVKALNTGIVIYSGSCEYLGNFLVIDHGLGIRTLYGHLSSINVSVGDILKAGESIGQTGKLNNKAPEGVLVQCYVYDIPIDYEIIAGNSLNLYKEDK